MNNKVCLDKLNFGECTKREDCQVCNNENKLVNQLENLNINLNKNAKGYVPKSKRLDNDQNSQSENQNKLNFNLKAQEYVPKFLTENKIHNNNNGQLNNLENEEEFDQQEDNEDEFDMIMKDIIDNEVLEEIEDDDESDEERWFPKFKDCDCCKGFVYKCKGVACRNMNICYCKVKDECDEEDY